MVLGWLYVIGLSCRSYRIVTKIALIYQDVWCLTGDSCFYLAFLSIKCEVNFPKYDMQGREYGMRMRMVNCFSFAVIACCSYQFLNFYTFCFSFGKERSVSSSEYQWAWRILLKKRHLFVFTNFCVQHRMDLGYIIAYDVQRQDAEKQQLLGIQKMTQIKTLNYVLQKSCAGHGFFFPSRT